MLIQLQNAEVYEHKGLYLNVNQIESVQPWYDSKSRKIKGAEINCISGKTYFVLNKLVEVLDKIQEKEVRE